MTSPRRTRPSPAWQVELLEERALLTAVYGPAGYEPPPIPAPSNSRAWISSWADRVVAFAEARPTLVSGSAPAPFLSPDFTLASEPRDVWITGNARPAGMIRSNEAFAFGTNSEPGVIMAYPGMPPGAELSHTIGVWKSDLISDDVSASPPFLALTTRDGASGFGPPGRVFAVMSLFGRSRDEFDGGGPIRFGFRFGPKPFFPISPGTSWEDGAVDDASPHFWFAESFFQSLTSSESSARTDSGSNPNSNSSSSSNAPGDGRNLPPATSNRSTTLSSAASDSSRDSVMVLVNAKAWAGEVSLASIILSRGEFLPGALFPEEELPELDAVLSALLNDWLGESTELTPPLASPLQQITTLDPLDESSLALTATLLTVPNAPQGTTTAGPGPISAPPPRGKANPDAEAEAEADVSPHAATAAPPSWAGFVIGLDEAFEANRRAVRHWPTIEELGGAAGRGNEAIAPPPPAPAPANEASQQNAAIDEAIQHLDRETTPPSSPLDELLLEVLEEAEADGATSHTEIKSWRDVAGPASLSFAVIPALWAERLALTPSSRKTR